MPNIKSAMKRVRQSAEDRIRNRSEKTLLATQRRTFLAAVESKDKDKVAQQFRRYCSVLDKAAKKGMIKKNNADRKKQRAALMINKIPA